MDIELSEEELSELNAYILSESYKMNEKLPSGEELSAQEKVLVNNLVLYFKS